MLQDLRIDVLIQLYKGKGEKTECKNYRPNSFQSMVRKIYVEPLVDRARKGTEGLNDDKQRGFGPGKGSVKKHERRSA